MILIVTAFLLAANATPTPTATPWPAPDFAMTISAAPPTVDVSIPSWCPSSEWGDDDTAAIVAAETTPDTPEQVLEAQAIVVRSFAYSHDFMRNDPAIRSLRNRTWKRDDAHFIAVLSAVQRTNYLVLRDARGKIATSAFESACRLDTNAAFDGDGVSVRGRPAILDSQPGPALCRAGAEQRARQGESAQQILARYFPTAHLAP